MSLKRDAQKQAVYDWQHRYFSRKNSIEMKPEECTALVEDICRCYGVNVPEMRYPDGYQSDISFYRAFPCSITLYKWARQRYIVIHEIAHHICSLNYQDESNHGPIYFSIFAYLISIYMNIPLYEIFHKAEQMKIKAEKYNFPKFKPGMNPNPSFIKNFS